jgi:predicted enzyme related to lactoylglutathione lyase
LTANLGEGWEGVLGFQRVPNRRCEGNRVHLDIAVADRRREVTRVRALGGEVVRETPEYTVMRDPEGNQFCVAERP